MYLLYTRNETKTRKIPLGDGSFLKLLPCNEGWYCDAKFKDHAPGGYTEVESVTFLDTSEA